MNMCLVCTTIGVLASTALTPIMLKRRNKERRRRERERMEIASRPVPEKCYIEKALLWQIDHRDHVNRLISHVDVGYPPTGSDVRDPRMWSGSHWLWLKNTSGFLKYNG